MSQAENIAEALDPFLSRATDGDLPMLLAILERRAAGFYRGWAAEAADSVERDGLLACAEIEDAIASFVESLEADVQGRKEALARRFAGMLEAYASVLEGRSRREQLQLQAEGELGGVDLLKQLSGAATGAVAARYAALALCEASNAAFLRSLLEGEGRP